MSKSRSLGVVLLALAAGFVGAGIFNGLFGRQRVVTAKEFRVVDFQGRIRATLGPVSPLAKPGATAAHVGLHLFGEDGKARVELVWEEVRSPQGVPVSNATLSLRNREGIAQGAVQLNETEHQSTVALTLRDGGGKLLWLQPGSAALTGVGASVTLATQPDRRDVVLAAPQDGGTPILHLVTRGADPLQPRTVIAVADSQGKILWSAPQ